MQKYFSLRITLWDEGGEGQCHRGERPGAVSNSGVMFLGGTLCDLGLFAHKEAAYTSRSWAEEISTSPGPCF